MIYRILHIAWKIFWSSILVLSGTIILFAGALFLLLQTDPAKVYLSERAETWFNNNFQGTVTIGEVDGILPLHAELHNVVLKYEDERVASFESLKLSVDLIALLRNHITINDIDLDDPDVVLRHDQSGVYTLLRAFERITKKEKQAGPDTETLQAQTLRTVDIYAPFLRIQNGHITIADWPDQRTAGYFSEPFHIRDINMEMFLEISEDQRYLDINHITMLLADLGDRELVFSGQIYNDSRHLEFNGMNIGLGASYVKWESNLTGINLLAPNVSDQLKNAPVTAMINESFLDPSELKLLYSDLPDGLHGASAGFRLERQYDVIRLDDAFLNVGQSRILFQGLLENLRQPDKLAYNVELNELTLHDDELFLMAPDAAGLPFNDWPSISSDGSFSGTRDTLQMDLDLGFPEGQLTLAGGVLLKQSYPMEMTIFGDDINLASFKGLEHHPSLFNTEIYVASENTGDDKPEFVFNLDIFDSHYDHYRIPDLHVDAYYSDRIIKHEFSYYQNEAFVSGQGHVDFNDDRTHLLLSGRSQGLNLGEITDRGTLPESSWNMSYDLNWHGFDPDDSFGRLVVDIMPSRVNGTDLPPHQIYLDLNHPGSDERSLRLTSTVMDLLMEGQITFSSIGELFNHWQEDIVAKAREELLFEEPEASDTASTGTAVFEDPLEANIFLEFKDLELLKKYIPHFPLISSRGTLDMDITAGSDDLNFDARWQDDHTEWNGFSVTRSNVIMSGSFSSKHRLQEQMNVDIDLRMDQLVYNDQKIDTLFWNLDIQNEELISRIRISNFFDDIRFSTHVSGSLADDNVSLAFNELLIGNDRYLWQTEQEPVIKLDSQGKLIVNQFNLASGSDHVFVDGTFSSSEEDSVIYRFDGVNLDRISRMIDGRIDFQGELNGDFVTKDLLNHPVFQGIVNVDRLAFGGRVIGDIELTSAFNPAEERFDTKLSVVTDEEKYSDYIEQNNGTKQNVTAEGWFRAPDADYPEDSLYYFDVNAEQLDAWFLIYFMESIFESVEGRGTGTGYIAGDFNNIDFMGDFNISEATVIPTFFETEYMLAGNVTMTRSDGITFHDLDVRDRANGTGMLSGNYDFNDFQPEKFMDITLQMDNLRFLNNLDGPDVPFFGSMAGTGIVNISGSNVSPFVRTIEPIHTTSQSRLSIPLVDQGLDNDQARFIRFVSDFADYDLSRRLTDDPAVLRQIDRSFMEVFRLDLQFVAAQNSTVQLIFDPVTGEIVNAQGSGRVRINLEDENLEIFGNFSIDDGDYQFVGGDILTRRFNLREGGTIRWDGDPTNALLDITAVYRARANIAPLMGAGPEETNRIPVELLLQITGPIDNIENDFYFDFPNAIDATQNAAVLNVLNSEEQKLLQATSLLFTGGFISGALVGDTQTQELGTTLQARAGQVGLSQLLSTQINTLLSDNLLNLDVDLNLLGFDQADLGIALRLFDDRLVLRREGELGGEETNIGDLGATYRINPNLSVEIFHRKDPMLMSILGTQADVENVNGVGLEAQFRFNSWQDFGNRIWRNVTTVFGLFGSNDDNEENEFEPGMAATEP